MSNTAKVYLASKGMDGMMHQMTRYSPHGVPILDFYQLTRGCTWNNCTIDGGHRSRFVNRMKAQKVLNLICQVVG